MGKSDLMDRVAQDLASGRTQPALQRLHSLVTAHPTDLDLRSRLAAVYRSTGDPVEAGRWSYLDGARESVEVAAFERAFPAHRRLKAIRWPAGVMAPTEHSRQCLDELAGQQRTPQPAVTPLARHRAYSASFLLGLLAVAALAALGAATVLEWLS